MTQVLYWYVDVNHAPDVKAADSVKVSVVESTVHVHLLFFFPRYSSLPYYSNVEPALTRPESINYMY